MTWQPVLATLYRLVSWYHVVQVSILFTKFHVTNQNGHPPAWHKAQNLGEWSGPECLAKHVARGLSVKNTLAWNGDGILGELVTQKILEKSVIYEFKAGSCTFFCILTRGLLWLTATSSPKKMGRQPHWPASRTACDCDFHLKWVNISFKKEVGGLDFSHRLRKQ